MGDNNNEKIRFMVDYGKRKCGCKRCKKPIEKATLRIAKCQPNFFNEGSGEIKMYYHVECIFEMFSKGRATTKKIEKSSDIIGFDILNDSDQQLIEKCIAEMHEKMNAPKTPSKKKSTKKSKTDGVTKEEKSPVKDKTVLVKKDTNKRKSTGEGKHSESIPKKKSKKSSKSKGKLED